jgi:hypothetical protein
MKTPIPRLSTTYKICWLIAALNLLSISYASAQLCTSPGTTLFGMTGTGAVHQITAATGVTGARINNVVGTPSQANGLGFNPLNSRLYYFRRNIQTPPQEFVTYNPVTGVTSLLPNCPSSSIINLGCFNNAGSAYYAIDAFGSLFCYRPGTNTWVTISSSLRNQYGVTLRSIISTSAIPTVSDRIYGDMAMDGSGNLWILISGPNNYGLYKYPAPVPTVATAGVITIQEVLPPTTPTPGLQSIGGVAFNSTGALYISTNTPDNKLYRLESNYSLTYLSQMDRDGIGTDLSSCNYPMFVLSQQWKEFDASLKSQDKISLAWSISEEPETKGYIVEHSVDGKNWEQVVQIQATGKNGNVNNYAYDHNTAGSGKHFYRIARTDVNEKISYSDTKIIYSSGNAAFSIFPNPAQDQLQVETTGVLYTAGTTVIVSDQTGRLMFRKPLEKGANKLDITALRPGHYLVTIETATGQKLTHKFLKN